ncbi:hypothetical protein SDC9_71713 [bioreactor metagenome]|uniref:Uncharacterized protein n=1 Tax=bioreactor metagenome TaxID=1076179 RepID=A0A644YFC4_9ZZZZ
MFSGEITIPESGSNVPTGGTSGVAVFVGSIVGVWVMDCVELYSRVGVNSITDCEGNSHDERKNGISNIAIKKGNLYQNV